MLPLLLFCILISFKLCAGSGKGAQNQQAAPEVLVNTPNLTRDFITRLKDRNFSSYFIAPSDDSFCQLIKPVEAYNQVRREDKIDRYGEIMWTDYILRNSIAPHDQKIVTVTEYYVKVKGSIKGNSSSILRSLSSEQSRANCNCLRSLANTPKAGNFVKREANKKCSNILCAQEARNQIAAGTTDRTLKELWTECFGENEFEQARNHGELAQMIEELEIPIESKEPDIVPFESNEDE